MSAVPTGEYGKKRKHIISNSPKNRKKRKLTKSSSINSEFKSTKESLEIVSKFHTINKRIEQIRNNSYLSQDEKEKKIKKYKKEIDNLGGLEKYQRASIFGANTNDNAKFNASKWVINELKQRNIININKQIKKEEKKEKKEEEENNINNENKMKMLDVGAIDNQYLHYLSWLNIIPIDLNPQHPSVIKADFFNYAKDYINNIHDIDINKDNNTLNSSSNKPFDIIILSLVINFIGDIKKRGEMLALCSHPKLLKKNGLLFIVLPSACIQNSRYMKYSRFLHILQSLGFILESHKLSKKLVFWIFKLQEPKTIYNSDTDTFIYEKEYPRKLVRGGKTCNNFTILLQN